MPSSCSLWILCNLYQGFKKKKWQLVAQNRKWYCFIRIWSWSLKPAASLLIVVRVAEHACEDTSNRILKPSTYWLQKHVLKPMLAILTTYMEARLKSQIAYCAELHHVTLQYPENSLLAKWKHRSAWWYPNKPDVHVKSEILMANCGLLEGKLIFSAHARLSKLFLENFSIFIDIETKLFKTFQNLFD